MKLKNRILSLLLVVCMLVTLLPVSALAVGIDRGQQTVEAPPVESQSNAPEADMAEPQTDGEITITPEEKAEALEANRPEQAEPVTVTVEEVENPGVDLKQNLNKTPETVEQAPFAQDESVRVIVVLEDKGLLEQGFSTAEIASANARVERQVETLAKRQENVLQSIEKIVDEPVEVKYHYNVAINGMALEVPYGDLEEIQALPGVKAAFVAPQYDVPEDMTDATIDTHTYVTKDTVGSVKTWETLGYSGQGMRIAIIDTGLDEDHPSFAADPALTETSLTTEEIASVLKDTNAYNLYMAHSPVELTADKLYRSAKVPFGFNYVDETLDITHDNDDGNTHGTHVAGIAAANRMEDTDVVGVAPDAQLIIMKVFGVKGGAFFDDILAALEDCYRLNVDAVNMSLGTPAGFTSDSAYTDEIFSRILESDMIASISAGNSYSAAFMNGYGTNHNLAEDPDNSVMSSPATYVGGTVVASVENGYVMSNYISVDDVNMPFTDVAKFPITDLAGDELTYVMVPGFGTAQDFAQVDVTGKVAVVSRGNLDFTEKQKNAYDGGAIAIIVYDNVEGTLSYMVDSELLPNVFVSKGSGAILAEKAVNGEGTLVVHGKDEMIPVESSIGGQMSDFSSWGVSPDLQLQPDVTAPGGNIYSTINGGYGNMSGTSMAAPHIAGMSALVLQYLRDKYDLTDAQAHTIAEALIMSTATPVIETSGLEYSPRKQGAGSANVYDAITSPAYLTVKGDTPKASMGDDDTRTGVYRFSFEVNNLTDEALTYLLDSSVLTDDVDLTYADYGYYFMGETSRQLSASVEFSLKNGVLPTEYDYNVDGETDMDDVQALLDAVNGLSEIKAGYDFNGDGKTDTADAQALYEMIQEGFTALNVVNVPAGGSVKIYATVTLSDEDKAYMGKYYENGIYVDGFARLYAQDEDAVDLSLPFMGFYGDWSDARIFDTGWYYEEEPEINRFLNIIYTNFGSQYSVLGWNPYVEDVYDPSNNVLSPNGDGYQDVVDDIYLALMRNVKEVNFTWRNAETGKTIFSTGAEYVRKSYYNTSYDLCIPMIVKQYCEMFDFSNVQNNDQLTLTVDGYLDDGDKLVDETITVPVYIDTEAPTIYTDEITYIYNPEDDSRRIEFYVSDNYKLASVAVVTEASTVFEMIPVENVPGEKAKVSVDVTDFDASFYLAACDYGCNETYYKVTFAGQENMQKDTFYGYRAYSSYLSGGYRFGTGAYNGWYSFKTADAMFQHTSPNVSGDAAVYAAEYVDGYVIGVDANCNIFAMVAGDWNRLPLGKLEIEGEAYPALDMAFDYTTDTLYVLTDELEEGSGQYLVELDYRTGEVTVVDKLTGIDSKSGTGITLACDNEGVLYTIDYFTGSLCTIDKDTAVATFVGETGYKPYYQQSMMVDHATNKLYWAAYSGYYSDSVFYEVDKATGKLTPLNYIQNNGEMTGLFKVYHPDKKLFPEDSKLEGLVLSTDDVNLNVGKSVTVKCTPWPYYTEMGELTWTSANEKVATVKDGVITAVGEGETTITVTCGKITATCYATVSDITANLRLYDNYHRAWLSLDAASPERAREITSARLSLYGYTGAAYWNGNIYACEHGGNIYRFDPDTLEGIKIGGTSDTLYAMAFNYTDAYMYAVAGYDNASGGYYYLSRVNLQTGGNQNVMFLNDAVGQPIGGMAIDYEGNFYMLCLNQDAYQMELVKFRLDENDKVVDLERAVLSSLAVPEDYCSITYSGSNDALFCAYDGGKLLYIDISNMESPKILELGDMERTTASGVSYNMGLIEIPVKEPETQYAEMTSVTMSDSYLLMQGCSTNVTLSMEPWNANLNVRYSVKDSKVATVDSSGILTAVGPGETTLAVYVEALDETLEATVTVVKSTGKLYGFMLSNYVISSNYCWMSVEDTDVANTFQATSPHVQKFQVYAGAYCDGTMYACINGGYEYDYKFLIVRVNSVSEHSVEILKRSPYDVRDMGFDYTTGTLYAIVQGGMVEGALAQIDMDTGDVVLIGDTGMALSAMTVDGQGRVFAVGADNYLYELDKDTAEATQIGYTGSSQYVGKYQSMYYDPDTGNTYWAEGFGINLVDLETGASTYLGTIGYAGMQVTSLYTVPDVAPTVPETVAPTGVRLDTEKNAVAVGKTVSLTAHVLPISKASVDKTVTWTSSDETVATVEDGVVTGVSVGTATITATSVNGKTATCEITVLEKERRFYAYSETDRQWVSFSAENPTELTVERKDKEGEPLIRAATWTGETLYAYDEDGRFYTIDPDTFERHLVGDALYGKTITYQLRGVITECEIFTTDLSWDAATGKLYVALLGHLPNPPGYNDPYQKYTEQICEVDVTTGDVTVVFENDTTFPANLIVLNNRAFWVDCYTLGILAHVDLYSGQGYEKPYLVQGYWGKYYGARGLIQDEYTGTIYTIRDKDRWGDGGGKPKLAILNLGDADCIELSNIGDGTGVYNSLFIR